MGETPPIGKTVGLGLQFSLIASAALLVTPVIVVTQAAAESGNRYDLASYLNWMVFASMIVVGISTLIQVRRIGPFGGGGFLPMFTAAFAIPFAITALVDGGPSTLTALVIVTAIVQLAVSRWLFILRRIVTPTVGGIVMMILSVTLASVVFGILDRATEEDPTNPTITTLVTVTIVAALALRGSALMRLWGPLVGIVGGCITAAMLGIYDYQRIIDAPWIGFPSVPSELLQVPDIGIEFWTLLPGFLFLGVIIAIQTNGAAIAVQGASYREALAVDFRGVQGALAGTSVSNFLAGIAGTVPNIVNPGSAAFTQVTGVASKSIGYAVGIILIVLAFIPKASGLLSSIPGPVVTGYLLLVVGTLFVDGARTIIQSEENRQKVLVAGICFWIGAAFQFDLFNLPDLGPVWAAIFSSGITTGGFAAILMILYLEWTSPRRMRFQSKLHIDSLPELNDFMVKFADSRGWDDAMKAKLTAVAEETLLTLAPLDLSLDLVEEEEPDPANDRRLSVVAANDGNVATLEFIGGIEEGGTNIEDRVHQLQQHEAETVVEHELSLALLRSYASSVQHRQYATTDVITVRVEPSEAA